MPFDVDFLVEEEGVARHDRFRHHVARVGQVLDVPVVGIASADAGEIRPGALRAPLERMVVHRLGREAVVAVAFDLVAERADHLAVADVAALADVDVAAREFERRVGAHALHLLDRVLRGRTAARSATRPPMVTTRKLRISSSVALFSIALCLSRTAIVPSPYSAGTMARAAVASRAARAPSSRGCRHMISAPSEEQQRRRSARIT